MVWGEENKTPSAYSSGFSFSFILKVILNYAPAALLKQIASGNRLPLLTSAWWLVVYNEHCAAVREAESVPRRN